MFFVLFQDVFLVCFSLANCQEFEIVQSYWFAEVQDMLFNNQYFVLKK